MKQILLAGLVSLGLVSLAQAGMMTSMSSVMVSGSTSRTSPGTSTFMSDTPTFQQFDPTTGTLISATLQYDIGGTVNLTTSVFNTGYVRFSYNGENQQINYDTDINPMLTFTGPDNTVNLTLADVTGTGTFDLGQFTAQYNLNLGTFPGEASGDATLDFTLTYEYDEAAPPPPAVPEPSTFALLGIGGVALVGYGWRRKRQQAA